MLPIEIIAELRNTFTTWIADQILMNIATRDVRLKRTAAKTLTIDDGAGGSVTVTILGALGATSIADGTLLTKGAGAAIGPALAVIAKSTASGASVGAAETDLWSYDLPAATLNADGRGAEILFWGNFAVNANAKALKLYIGATTLIIGPPSVAYQASWYGSAVVVRKGAAAEVAAASVNIDNNRVGQTKVAFPAENTANIITIKMTGQGVLNGDVTSEGYTVKAW